MLSEYVGQRDTLSMLMTTIRASQQRNGHLPNVLLLGAPGRGKSTLAAAIAEELNVPFVKLHAPSIRDAHGGDERAAMKERIQEAAGGVLFIDEIHALSRTVAEDLYRVMDEGTITVEVPVMGQATQRSFITAHKPDDLPPERRNEFRFRGPGVYSVMETVEVPTRQTRVETLDIGHITIAGATTDESLLPPAFLSRLSALVVRLRPYEEEELANIGINHAFGSLNVEVEADAAYELAVRSRKTPRRVKQLTERAFDWVAADGRNTITRADVIETCKAMGVDKYGLEEPHRIILRLLASSEKGLSRTSLAQRMGLPPKNSDMYFGELMEAGFVTIGTRHQVTPEGIAALEEVS